MTMTENKPVGFGDHVYIINEDVQPYTFKFERRRYVLEPNKKNPVPFEAAVLWTGDPRATDKMQSVRTEGGDVLFIPDRESEVRRLKVKYGGEENYQFPNIAVTTLDDQPIVTVLQDPEGNTVNPAVVTVEANTIASDRIRSLEEKLARLTALLEPEAGELTDFVNNSEVEATGDIPEDTAGTGTSSKGPGS